MERLAFFSFYDWDNIIDDYVIYYLKELKKTCDVVFIADNVLSKKELEKIEKLIYIKYAVVMESMILDHIKEVTSGQKKNDITKI